MAQSPNVEEPAGPPGLLTLLVGVLMVALDVAVVYALLATGGIPSAVVYGGTALVAVVIGGSFLTVVARRFVASPSTPTSDPSTPARIARVIVSITVLTGVTVLLGYGGGLLLALSAAVGGPDPAVGDGDLLRDRLLEWPERNREFMQTDGYGELPLQP